MPEKACCPTYSQYSECVNSLLYGENICILATLLRLRLSHSIGEEGIALRAIENSIIFPWRAVHLPTWGIVSLAGSAYRVGRINGPVQCNCCASYSSLPFPWPPLLRPNHEPSYNAVPWSGTCASPDIS